MIVTTEIESAVKNIRYYEGKIHELLSVQFDKDIQETTLLGEHLTDSSFFGKHFTDITGQIAASCEVILRACQNIERQVKIAKETSKAKIRKE